MKYLAMSIIGKPQTKIVHELAKLVRSSGCNLIETRWYTVGGEAMGYCYLSGNWNAIAKLETNLPGFERKYEISLVPRRIEPKEPQPERLPYTIYLTALDRPGILEEIMEFLVSEDIEILEINGYSFQAKYTQAPMVSLTVPITLSSNLLISDFRERFIIFCDELNLDATVEPDKNGT